MRSFRRGVPMLAHFAYREASVAPSGASGRSRRAHGVPARLPGGSRQRTTTVDPLPSARLAGPDGNRTDDPTRTRRRRRHGPRGDDRHRAAHRGLRPRRSAPTAPARSPRSARRSPTSCCSTSCCPAWTASRCAVASAPSRARRSSCSPPSPTPPTSCKGLESGADDYMVKPFNPKELVARIRTRLRPAPDPVVDDARRRRPHHRRRGPRGAARRRAHQPHARSSSTCCSRSRPSRSRCSPARCCSSRCGATTTRPTPGW